MSANSNLRQSTNDPFALEDHLLDVVYAQLPEMLVGKSKQLLAQHRKYAVGSIVPDLVLVISSRTVVRSVSAKKLSIIDCSVLNAINRSKCTSVEQIADKLYARSSSVRTSIERLTKAGIVSSRAERFFIRRNVMKQTAQVVSIEAKLSRWRDAIKQAKAYLRFSNVAYVALPAARVDRIRQVRQDCKEAGVGLISVSSTACKIVVRGPVSPASTGEWFWVLNKTRGLGL